MQHLLFLYFVVSLAFGFFSLGTALLTYRKRREAAIGSLVMFQASCITVTAYLVLRFYYSAAGGGNNEMLVRVLEFFETYVIKLILMLYPTFHFTAYFFEIPKRRIKTGTAASYIVALVLLDIVFERIINDNEGAIEQTGELLVYALSVLFLLYVLGAGIAGFAAQRRKGGLGLSYLILLSVFIAFYVFRQFLGEGFSLNTFPAFSVGLSAFTWLYITDREPADTGETMRRAAVDLNRFGISDREAEVVQRILLGYSNERIGRELCISTNTVKTHVRSIFSKLEVNSRLELAARLNFMRPGDRNHPE